MGNLSLNLHLNGIALGAHCAPHKGNAISCPVTGSFGTALRYSPTGYTDPSINQQTAPAGLLSKPDAVQVVPRGIVGPALALREFTLRPERQRQFLKLGKDGKVLRCVGRIIVTIVRGDSAVPLTAQSGNVQRGAVLAHEISNLSIAALALSPTWSRGWLI